MMFLPEVANGPEAFAGYPLPVFTGDVCNPEAAIPIEFQSFCASVTKTQYNISPLYQLDTFDWTVLILYFSILFVLAVSSRVVPCALLRQRTFPNPRPIADRS